MGEVPMYQHGRHVCTPTFHQDAHSFSTKQRVLKLALVTYIAF